ncbi:PTS system cellobiose-specific EIIB component [Neobacillus rhizosphaerae]|uniref:PTS system cellobiose-specific EIIB component n=1 Tax=Neobacillus rhizosphaerae TaxID=2880965 RepID=A0ABM9EUR1_9BACI|nr:PTS sugar transporter subunit IIB [Neobacillus rhizosphaerae]CAH2715870.1 PTS system cellobiose-specific EIIB component [Neobacillus rhizosphaerae]
MKNLYILLCCGAGMSSGFLAQKARKAAKKRGLDIKIEAKSENEAASHLATIDVLLLGPHYQAYKEEFAKLGKPLNVPVDVIPQKIYGTLDGEKLLDFALEIIENKSK